MPMKNQTETVQCIPSKSRRLSHISILPEFKGNLQSFYIFCLTSFIILSPLCCPPYLAFSSSVRRHPKSRVSARVLHFPGSTWPVRETPEASWGPGSPKTSPHPLWKATQAREDVFIEGHFQSCSFPIASPGRERATTKYRLGQLHNFIPFNSSCYINTSQYTEVSPSVSWGQPGWTFFPHTDGKEATALSSWELLCIFMEPKAESQLP